MNSQRICANLCRARAAVAYLEDADKLSVDPAVSARIRAAIEHIESVEVALEQERDFKLIGVMPVTVGVPVVLATMVSDHRLLPSA